MRAGSCARAASGHATAAPPTSDMNLRRFDELGVQVGAFAARGAPSTLNQLGLQPWCSFA